MKCFWAIFVSDESKLNKIKRKKYDEKTFFGLRGLRKNFNSLKTKENDLHY